MVDKHCTMAFTPLRILVCILDSYQMSQVANLERSVVHIQSFVVISLPGSLILCYRNFHI